jgi:CubicO group peptidase (beta-lactamase class C family)
VSTPIAALVQLLRERTLDQSWGTGFQLCVVQGDRVLVSEAFGTDGLGRPVSNESMFAIYCAGKPVTALAVGALIDQNEVSLNDVLGNILGGPLHPLLQRTTIEQLLTHTAGLWQYPALAFLTMKPESRRDAVRWLEPSTQAPGGQYCDFVAWELLSQVIEELSGQTFEQAVDTLVLEPCGLAGEIRFTMHSTELDRLRLNVDVQSGAPMPILWERSKSNLSDVRPSGGALASMEALAQLYQNAIDALDGKPGAVLSKPTISALVESRTSAAMDHCLQRVCRYSPGFMTDLSLPDFGAHFGERTFGHSGLNGMTFAGADPDTTTVFAVHVNGVTRHDEPVEGNPNNSPLARRRLICSMIAAAVEREGSL